MAVRDQQRIVVIGVNYGTDDAALRFVCSISKIGVDANVNVVIVDNTERNDSSEFFDLIRDKSPDTVCIKTPSNLGYFGGANFGLDHYLRSSAYPDWVIISNVDIEFRDKALLSHLRDVNDRETVGVIAPCIWSNRSHRDLNPRLVVRPSRKKIKFLKLIFGNFYLLNIYELLSAAKSILFYTANKNLLQPVRIGLARLRSKSGLISTSVSKDSLKFIYAPQGSCIVFSKLFFSLGGKLNYPKFLFGEEIFVAETAKNLGLRVVYNPRLKVWHDDHSSTGFPRSRKIASYLHESVKYLTDTYFI